MRGLAFLFVFFLSTLLPIWLLLVLVGAYAFKWRAYELIGLGLLIDAYFAGLKQFPIYTASILIVVFLVPYLKNKFLLYHNGWPV